MELIPFQHVFEHAPPALVMTAHILLPAFDKEDPATLSRHIIPVLLRESLGYDGVVVTDDLEMKAVDDRYQMTEVVRLGLSADVDVFLICHEEEKQELALETLHKLVVDGEVSLDRIQRSLQRIRRSKLVLKGTSVPSVGQLHEALCQPEALQWAERMKQGA